MFCVQFFSTVELWCCPSDPFEFGVKVGECDVGVWAGLFVCWSCPVLGFLVNTLVLGLLAVEDVIELFFSEFFCGTTIFGAGVWWLEVGDNCNWIIEESS